MERSAEAPVRLVTPRLVLRCWSPDDAAALLAAIESSLDHLRPWMAWARREPEPIERKAARLQRWTRRFALGREFTWGVFCPERGQVLGGVGLHRRIGAGAAEIGYWIRADHAGRGLATEAAAAVTRAGFNGLGLHRLEIHCDPANAGSAGVARRLGFTGQVVVPGRILGPAAERRDAMIWRMLALEFPASPAAAVAVEAYDRMGSRVDL